MVGASLRHRGEELLGQRGGLEAYVARAQDDGHPAAASVGQSPVAAASSRCSGGRWRSIRSARHCAWTRPGCRCTACSARRGAGASSTTIAGRLTAAFDFAAHEALLESFPFAHTLQLDVTLTEQTLTVATTVHATGDTPVPIAFGFHPYLPLPGVAREDWHVELPVTEQLELDDADAADRRERRRWRSPPGPTRDAHVRRRLSRAPDGPFALQGGGRRIELALRPGLPVLAGLRSARRRADRLRADDRTHQRARRRRDRAPAIDPASATTRRSRSRCRMSELPFSETSPGALRLARLAREIALNHRPTRVEVLEPVIDPENERVLQAGQRVEIPRRRRWSSRRSTSSACSTKRARARRSNAPGLLPPAQR